MALCRRDDDGAERRDRSVTAFQRNTKWLLPLFRRESEILTREQRSRKEARIQRRNYARMNLDTRDL
jgi:hypothetical protein